MHAGPDFWSTGFRGVEQHGAQVKNTGEPLFRPAMNFPHFHNKQEHFVRKKTIQMPTCHALVFLCMGRLFFFRSDLAWILFDLKKMAK